MKNLLLGISILGAAASALAEPVEVPADSIRAAVESAFRAAAPPEARLEILSIPALRHEAAEPRIIVGLPETLDEPGPRKLPVSCRLGDRVVAHGVATVVVRVKRLVWIAGQDLDGHDPLDLSALRRESREFDRPTPRLFRPEPGARFRLTRDVPEGAILEVRDVLRIRDDERGPDPGRASVPDSSTRRSG